MLKLFPSAVALAALATASLAHAQEGGDNTGRDIVVYGQKSEGATLAEVEESLTVVTGEAIDREPILDLYDVARRVPNLVEVNGGRGFAIRGVQQSGPSFAGQGQTLAVYVDDLPLNARQTFAGPLDVWDLAQVEVYRGPQATTFGRNALAGAIYVRTADPTFEFDARARGELSERDGYQFAGALGGGLAGDTVAGRVSFSRQETDGFNTNTFLSEPADARRADTLRGKLLLRASDRFDALVTATWYDATRGDDLIEPLANVRRREIAYDTPAVQGSEGVLGSVRLRWRLSDRLELTSITAAQDGDYVRFEDFDGSPEPIATLDRTGEDRTFTQELRLRFDGGRARGVLGGFFLDGRQSFTDSFLVPITILDSRLPLTNFVSRVGDFVEKTRNWAVFGDGEFDLTDRLTLVAGARYDRERYGTRVFQVTAIQGALPPQFEFLRALAEGIVDDRLSTEFDAFLPKAGVKYDLGPATAGFTVSRGYRAGGVENNIVTGERNAFGAEHLTNYELALTGEARGITYALHAFYARWTDQQVSVPAVAGQPGLTVTRNAGESRLLGFEAEARGRVAEGLDAFGSVGLADTRFLDFPNPDGAPGEPADFDGNRFPYAPRWTAAAGLAWNADRPGPFASGTVTYRSASYNDVANLPENRASGAVVVDAQAGWRFDRFRLTAFARNLFNKFYYSARSATPGAEFARLGAPQVLGVRLDASY